MNEQYTRAPHQSTPSGSSPSPNAALLIDFDNVTMAMRSNLGQELRNFLNSDIVRGKVSVQRAYADWRRYPQYIVPLSEASIDLIFAPAYGSSKKNATDIRLAIDALELVFTRPEIGTYILLSGDSDFSSLVLKLKEYGKYVIGVGLQESSSDLLVQNCDEYYSYNSLSGLTSADEMSTQSHDPWELAERAIHRMDDRNDVMRSDRLKQVMLEMDAGFDEKDHGFSKFNRFLAEASSRGLVKLRKIGDGQYEVKPARELEDGGREAADEEKAAKRSGPERSDRGGEPSGRRASGGRGGRGDGGRGDGGRSDDRSRSRSRKSSKPSKPSGAVDASSLRAGYDLLRDVVSDLAGEDEPVRDSEVKREMLRREDGFDEAALGFSKFSRFLRQAHDEEVVDVAKDDDGNYHLAPAGSGIAEAGARSGGRDAGRSAGAREASGREEAAEAPSARERGRSGAPEAEGPSDDGGREADREARAEREAPAEDEEEASDEPEEQPSASGGSGRRRGRGLGRSRRGSRERTSPGSSGDDDAPAPGPVDAGGGEDEEDAGDAPADVSSEDAGSGAPAGDDGGRRGRRRGGLGRFRKGSRSGGSGRASSGSDSSEDESPTPGPVDEGGGEDEAAPRASGDAGDGDEDRAPAEAGAGRSGDTGRSDDTDRSGGTRASGEAGGNGAAPVPEDASDDPVGHMVGRWPGVGRKTAEKLVEAFGDDVFEVIDRSPDRLTEVLPDHRAQAVVEARRQDRERVEA